MIRIIYVNIKEKFELSGVCLRLKCLFGMNFHHLQWFLLSRCISTPRPWNYPIAGHTSGGRLVFLLGPVFQSPVGLGRLSNRLARGWLLLACSLQDWLTMLT